MAVRDRFGARSWGWRQRRAWKGIPEEENSEMPAPIGWHVINQLRAGEEGRGEVRLNMQLKRGMTYQAVQRTWKAVSRGGSGS